MHKSALPFGRKVYLRYISRNYHARSFAEASQKHLHLLYGAVLRFVKNYVCIVERAPAHICKRCNFYNAALGKILKRFRAKEVIKRIIKRPKIRIDLVLKIAGQKAQLFAGFNRGAGKNYLLYLLVLICQYGHCNGKICFARAGGANAEHYRIALERIHIFLLAKRFALYSPALGGEGHNVAFKLSNKVRVSFFCQINGIAYTAAVHVFAATHGYKQLVHNRFGKLRCLGGAFNAYAVARGNYTRTGFGAYYLQVFIEHAEKLYHLVHRFNGRLCDAKRFGRFTKVHFVIVVHIYLLPQQCFPLSLFLLWPLRRRPHPFHTRYAWVLLWRCAG